MNEILARDIHGNNPFNVHARLNLVRHFGPWMKFIPTMPFSDQAHMWLIDLVIQTLRMTLGCWTSYPGPPQHEMMQPALMVAQILSNPVPANPMLHHFVIPAVHVLLHAADFRSESGAALDGLSRILRAIRGHHIMAGTGWEEPVATAIQTRLEAGALEQDGEDVEWMNLPKQGYITSFAETFMRA